MKTFEKIALIILGIILFPAFLVGLITAYAARIVLIISYTLMLDFKQAQNIFIFTFKPFSYDGDYSKYF